MSVTGTIRVVPQLNEINVQDLATVTNPILKEYLTAFLTAGTGNNQANRIFADQRTLGATLNEDLDLNGATLKDAFGNSLAFLKMKSVLFYGAIANPADMVIGNAAANGWLGMVGGATHTITLAPGGTVFWSAPIAGKPVTAATADLLRVTAGAGGNHTYDILLVGTDV